MLSILGGGFGLYGYLPAALSLPDTSVVLPERYRSTVRARAELAPFEPLVHWVPTEHDAMLVANRIVVARRPADQQSVINALIRYPNVQSLVLEKPLAASPADSSLLAEGLHARNIPFRVGYTVSRTPWARALARLIGRPTAGEALVRWDFMAKHYSSPRATWKYETGAGGGALRFYGVQLLAAMTRETSEVPKLVSSSLTVDAQDTVREWRGAFEFASGTVVHLDVNSHSSAPRFSVHASGHDDIDLSDPFGELSAVDNQDVRASLLAEILSEPLSESDHLWTQRVHAVWLAAEAKAEIVSSVTASFSIPTN